MDCQQFEELSGAYVLGALTPEEQLFADEHLATCTHCQKIYRELKGVRDLLPLTVPQIQHSELAERHIMARIRAMEPGEKPQARRQKRLGRTSLLMLAAVLIIILLAALIARNQFLPQLVTNLPGLPSPTIVYALKSATGTPGIQGELITHPQQQTTTLIIHGLPPLEGTHVYQGWLIRENQPRSIGLFTVKDGVAILNFSGGIGGYETAAVSLEQGPAGSQAPHGQVIVAGSLKTPLQAEHSPKALLVVYQMHKKAVTAMSSSSVFPQMRGEG